MTKIEKVVEFMNWARSSTEEEVGRTLEVCLRPSPEARKLLGLYAKLKKTTESLEDARAELRMEKRRCRRCWLRPDQTSHRDLRRGQFRRVCPKCKRTVRIVNSSRPWR